MRNFVRLMLLLPLLGLAGCAQGGGGGGRGGPPPSAGASSRSLQGTEWTLAELGGSPVAIAEGRGAPTITLAASESRASGFAGCNRLTGTYESAADSLRFGAVGTTRMFCEGTMDLERQYLAALEATRRYRMGESGLELLGDDGTVLARFTGP